MKKLTLGLILGISFLVSVTIGGIIKIIKLCKNIKGKDRTIRSQSRKIRSLEKANHKA